MAELKLEVGKRYKDGLGDVITILEIDKEVTPDPFCYYGETDYNSGGWYDENGICASRINRFNLKEITD